MRTANALFRAGEAEVFQNHQRHYERYCALLQRARNAGDRARARSAARMLLFHLRELFQALPEQKQQVVKSILAAGV